MCVFEGWFPELRYRQAGLLDAQGLHHGHQEATDHVAQVVVDADEACGVREDRAQVHRHVVQVRPRSFPDAGGEEDVHGPDEEGQGRRREGCCFGRACHQGLNNPISFLILQI